jgi:spermidine synthase
VVDVTCVCEGGDNGDDIQGDRSGDPPRAPPPSLTSRRAMQDLRTRLRPGGVLAINVLGGGEAHLADVRAVVTAAFCEPRGQVRIVNTSEGNAVVVAVRAMDTARRAGRRMGRRDAGEPKAWAAACDALGLAVVK